MSIRQSDGEFNRMSGRNKLRRTKWESIEEPDRLKDALKDSGFASSKTRREKRDEIAFNNALKKALGE